MQVGRSRLRKGFLRIDQPANGLANAIINVTGTVVPGGTAVEGGWALVGQVPVSWGVTVLSGPTSTVWTRNSTGYPAVVGIYNYHVRLVANPLTRVVSAPITVS